MAYKQLPMIEVDVAKLHLDLENYRIPIAPDDEASALNYLFASEDVLDQVKLFLRDGYFDNEVPIAVKENGNYVILEGNRRISALKAIIDPSIAPMHGAQVDELRIRYATEVPNMPRKIRVLVVPDRAAPRKHIARLHTGIPKKRWSRDQQANYYYSFLGPDLGVDDLKALYPDVEIVRFLRMVAVRRFLSTVKFKDKSLREYVASSDLTMSSFEYAYRNSAIAAAIGIKFDAEGRIEPSRREPEAIGAALPPNVRIGLEYLMKGFRSEAFNTRSPEFKKNSERQIALIARLLGGSGAPDNGDEAPIGPSGAGNGEAEPSTSRGGSTEPNTDPPHSAGSPGRPGAIGAPGGSGGGGAGNGSGAASGGRGPNDPNTLNGLSVAGLPFDHIPSNLQKRVLELRAINVSRTPAAATMLLRSVLESAIKWHFDGVKPPVSGMLGEVFPSVRNAYGSERALKMSISTMGSGPASKPGSTNWFNTAAHNPHFEITPEDVRSAFSVVQPVLIRLMKPR